MKEKWEGNQVSGNFRNPWDIKLSFLKIVHLSLSVRVVLMLVRGRLATRWQGSDTFTSYSLTSLTTPDRVMPYRGGNL